MFRATSSFPRVSRRSRHALFIVTALVAVGGCGGSSSAPLPSAPAPVAPSITAQPAALSVTAGQLATFAVTTTGTAPITYQWRRDGVAIAGATSATYTTVTTTLGDNGASFSVVVTNSVSSVTSNAAVLTVVAPQVAPAFTAAPAAVTVVAPATASFTVAVTGQPAPTLQWQFTTDNGITWTNIAGATAATYVTPATSVADSFRGFRAVATNAAGVVNSAAAILVVSAPLQPDKLSIFAGATGLRGTVDGAAATARFNDPIGVAIDAAKNVFVTDWRNHTVRKISAAGVVSTLAGLPGTSGSTDGTGSAARFYFPSGIAIDPTTGDLIVAEQGNHLLRRVTQAGVVTTIAGVAGNIGTMRDNKLNNPNGVRVDASGTIYVANSNDHTIGFVTKAGVRGNIAGYPGRSGRSDGVDTLGTFWTPFDLVLDGAGNMYVTDRTNHTIRKIEIATKSVTTLAGVALTSGQTDGTGTAARFANPAGIVINSAGILYVADNVNNTIRRVTPAGVVTTVLGTPGTAPEQFRLGADPRLARPGFMAMLDDTRILMNMEFANSAVYLGIVP